MFNKLDLDQLGSEDTFWLALWLRLFGGIALLLATVFAGAYACDRQYQAHMQEMTKQGMCQVYMPGSQITTWEICKLPVATAADTDDQIDINLDDYRNNLQASSVR